MEKTFFQLIQIAIGTCDKFTRNLNAKEWSELYSICKKQSLIGVGFVGITRLPADQRPPMNQFVQWIYDAEKIKEKNQHISEECTILCKHLENDGMNSCIIKGQSNLTNYPEWLRDYRTAGDIDVIIRPKNGNGIKGSIEYGIKQCKLHNIPTGKICYHHMEIPFPSQDNNNDENCCNTEVESHHRATWMNSYFINKKLQKWLEDNMPFGHHRVKLGNSDFPTPPSSYNAVYQLIHINRHLFEEGIGLRQILDYNFVLTSLNPEDKAPVLRTLKGFGLAKFVSAVMYVLQQVFAMPDKYLLCTPNEKEGKFLLNEIMLAGNFGKYDSRINHNSSLSPQLSHNIEKTRHNLRLLTHYPEEVLWEPIFRTYHFFWRKLCLWK